MIYVFGLDGKCLERNEAPLSPGLEDAFRTNKGHDAVIVELAPDQFPPSAPYGVFYLVEGRVTIDPSWQPPAPPVDPLALLTQTIAENVASSPHDKRFMRQKEVGKKAITWIREHPTCTPDEAETYVMDLVLAAIPGQPVIPKLYFEYKGQPQGLAMSYLYEAIQRGYCPAGTPMTWQSIVGLIVGTPEEMLADWLISL